MDAADPQNETADALGWGAFFAEQVTEDERDLLPMRIATVHRARMTAVSAQGVVRLVLPLQANTGDYAVGDWVLVDPDTVMPKRRLERRALLQRRVDGGRAAGRSATCT